MILREAFRNIVANLMLYATLFVASMGLIWMSLDLVVDEAASFASRDEVFEQAGGYSFVVRGAGEGGVPTTTCDSARFRAQGIISSGGVIAETAASVPQDPTRTFLVQYVTPGYVAYAFPERQTYGRPDVTAGRDVGERFGLSQGSLLAYRDVTAGAAGSDLPPVQVTRLADEESRGNVSDSAVLVSRRPSIGLSVNACYIAAMPGMHDAVRATLPSLFSQVPGAQAADVLDVDELAALDVRGDYEARLGRWLWMVPAGVSGLGFVAITFIRRKEYGLYLILGVSRSALLVMMSIEASLTSLLAIAVGSLGAVLAATSQFHEPVVAENALTSILGVGALIVVAPLLSIGVVLAGGAVRLTKGD